LPYCTVSARPETSLLVPIAVTLLLNWSRNRAARQATCDESGVEPMPEAG
jgi:hypothetical protein